MCVQERLQRLRLRTDVPVVLRGLHHWLHGVRCAHAHARRSVCLQLDVRARLPVELECPCNRPRLTDRPAQGGTKGPSNPNRHDRCGSGMVATNNNPATRTINRNVTAGSAADWTRFNPWRAPGHAPTWDPCGRASGSFQATPGKGEFTNTTYAKLGDLGSQVLPRYDTGTVWAAGSTVETMTSFRAVHGGGYQFRLCPLSANLTEGARVSFYVWEKQVPDSDVCCVSGI